MFLINTVNYDRIDKYIWEAMRQLKGQEKYFSATKIMTPFSVIYVCFLINTVKFDLFKPLNETI